MKLRCPNVFSDEIKQYKNPSVSLYCSYTSLNFIPEGGRILFTKRKMAVAGLI